MNGEAWALLLVGAVMFLGSIALVAFHDTYIEGTGYVAAGGLMVMLLSQVRGSRRRQ